LRSSRCRLSCVAIPWAGLCFLCLLNCDLLLLLGFLQRLLLRVILVGGLVKEIDLRCNRSRQV
jgi:hypothetical protein